MNAPTTNTQSLGDPQRWGLPTDAIHHLADRLLGFWQRYVPCFKTKTRDTSDYGLAYLSGQLRMPNLRNFAHIARTQSLSGQNLQHFMSNSPWSSARRSHLKTYDSRKWDGQFGTCFIAERYSVRRLTAPTAH